MPREEIKTLDQLSTGQLREFLKGYTGNWRLDVPRLKGVAPPPIQKPYPAGVTLVDLISPDKLTVGNCPLPEAINRRRSRTGYTDDPLSGEVLSFLLWSTQGVSEIVRGENGAVAYHRRTVPSGGARHPFETYVLAARVSDLEPRLYRFLPVEHKLLPLSDDRHLMERVMEGCYRQEFVGRAAAVFLWTAIPFRTEWAYGYVAHRMIAIEIGHVCQNLYLAAEAVGMGACAVLGYDQGVLDRLLGVDGDEEFTLYVATVGGVPQEPGAP